MGHYSLISVGARALTVVMIIFLLFCAVIFVFAQNIDDSSSSHTTRNLLIDKRVESAIRTEIPRGVKIDDVNCGAASGDTMKCNLAFTTKHGGGRAVGQIISNHSTGRYEIYAIKFIGGAGGLVP
jgi:hypothetical protein